MATVPMGTDDTIYIGCMTQLPSSSSNAVARSSLVIMHFVPDFSLGTSDQTCGFTAYKFMYREIVKQPNGTGDVGPVHLVSDRVVVAPGASTFSFTGVNPRTSTHFTGTGAVNSFSGRLTISISNLDGSGQSTQFSGINPVGRLCVDQLDLSNPRTFESVLGLASVAVPSGGAAETALV